MVQKYDRNATSLFSVISIIFFVFGIILFSVGFGLYDKDFMNCDDDKASLATILDSNTYTTNCNNCLRLRVQYHTNEVGEVSSYMIVRTRWAAGFASLQDANEVGDLITIYYNSDTPGSPNPERRICEPDGGLFIMVIMGIIIVIFGYAIAIILFFIAHNSHKVIINKRPKTASRYPPNQGLRPIIIRDPQKTQIESKQTTNNEGYTKEFLLGDETSA